MKIYVVTDGVKYLRKSKKNKLSLSCFEDASLFTRLEDAQRAMEHGVNCLPKRPTLKIVTVDCSCSTEERPVDEAKDNIDEARSPFGSIDGYKRIVDDAISSAKLEQRKLFDRLSVVDRQLTDMYHYMEFTNLNACAGYKAYKRCQQILKERRIIKDAVALTQITINQLLEAQKAVLRTSEKMDSRTYEPRELSELFGNAEVAQAAS